MANSRDQEDLLSILLTKVRAHDVVLGNFRLSGTWGFHRKAIQGCAFRVSMGRSFYLKIQDHPLIEVAPGDVILLPHGAAHTILSTPDAAPIPFEALALQHTADLEHQPLVFSAEGAGEVTELLAGIVTYLAEEADALFKVLPEVIHVSRKETSLAPWLAPTLKTLIDESLQRQPGWKVAAARLTDVLLVNVLRAYLAAKGNEPGWLRALTHPQIAEAMRMIHGQIRKDWTVSRLASAVGMSRSRFAREFELLVGSSPIVYLIDQRISIAAGILASANRPSISNVASAVGYQSEKGFARAFTRKYGVGPSVYAKKSAPNRAKLLNWRSGRDSNPRPPA